MEYVEDSAGVALSTTATANTAIDNGTVNQTTTPPPPPLIPTAPPTMASDQACTNDHSLLIKPIRIKDSTIRTIVDCVRNGTAEVRDLLVSECELIFECRVCRNLHRSLANFIAHKRVYCKEHCCESMPLFEHADDEAIVVQPESPITPSATAVEATTAVISMDETPSASNLSPNEDGEDDEATTSEILVSTQRIYRPLAKKIIVREPCSDSIASSSSAGDTCKRRPVRDFFDGILKNLKERSVRRSQTSITLSNIDGNPNAVFQQGMGAHTFAVSDAMSTVVVKTEVDPRAVLEASRNSVETVKTDISIDVCDAVVRSSDLPSPQDSPRSSPSPLLCPPPPPPPPPTTLLLPAHPRQPMVKLLGASKTALPPSSSRQLSRTGRMMNGKITSVPCIKCRTLFTSVKTLIAHLKSVHSKTRVYFMCIFCQNKFTNSWAVGRHIMRKHKRSKLQISKLKERIQQKAFKNVLEDRSTSDESDSESYSGRGAISSKRREERLSIPDGDSKSRNLRNKRALHRCGSCKKTFVERRSLSIHEKACGGGGGGDVRLERSKSIGRSGQPPINGRSKNGNIRRKDSSAHAQADDKKGGRGRRVAAIRGSHPSTVSLSEIKSLECNKCGIKFSNLSNCRRHVAKHIGLNRYKCKHCDYQSYHRYNVCYHMQSSHPREVAGKTLLAIKNSLVNVGLLTTPQSRSSAPSSDNARVQGSAKTTFKTKTENFTASSSGTMTKHSNDKRSRETLTEIKPSRRKTSAPKKTTPATVKSIMNDKTESVPPHSPPPPRDVVIQPPRSTSATGFNISTRRNPRVFDTTPYRRDDSDNRRQQPTTTLETRSGRYVKVDLLRDSTRRKISATSKESKNIEQIVNGTKTEEALETATVVTAADETN